MKVAVVLMSSLVEGNAGCCSRRATARPRAERAVAELAAAMEETVFMSSQDVAAPANACREGARQRASTWCARCSCNAGTDRRAECRVCLALAEAVV